MFRWYRNWRQEKRIASHLYTIGKAGLVGIDPTGEIGISESGFLSYVMENVSPEDIDAFLSSVVAKVTELRMERGMKLRRRNLVREKVSAIIVDNISPGICD